MNFFIAALGVLGVASSGPLIAATLGATTVSALAIAFWRNAIGAVVMATPTLVREPRQFGAISGREFRWSLLAAVALALHFACFITSLQLTSVAAATALVCLQSGWIAVFQLFRGTKHRWPAFPARSPMRNAPAWRRSGCRYSRPAWTAMSNSADTTR